MTKTIDPQDYIQHAEPGTMAYARFSADTGGMQTGFFIREEPKYVKAFGRHPIIEMRGGLMQEGRVALVATLLRVGAGKDAQLYETWWNWHGPINRESFYDLSSQERLAVMFYVPDRSTSVTVTNAYRDLFTRAVASVSAMQAWSMQEFNQARERIYTRYPNVQDLWTALEKHG